MHAKKKWVNELICLALIVIFPISVIGQPAAPPAQPAQPTAPAKPLPPADPTAILKVIPQDATAFLAIQNLKQLDATIQAIALQLGFPLGPNGMFPAPLDWVKGNFGIMGGLNENSSLALVVLDCKDVPNMQALADAGKVAIFIPCTDSNALTAAMSPTKEGELIKFNFMENQLYGAEKGGFLVLSTQAQAVQAVIKAQGQGVLKTMSPERVKAFGKHDLFGWFSPQRISNEIRLEIAEFLKGLMLMGNPNADQEYIEESTKNMTRLIDEMLVWTFGLKLDAKEGLKLNFYGQAKEGTEMAEQMAAIKPADKPLFVGLPDERVIFAMGSTINANNPAQEKQIRTALNQIMKAPQQMGIDLSQNHLDTIKDTLIKLILSTKSLCFSISSLSPQDGKGLVGAAKIVRVDNSQKFLTEVRGFMKTLKQIIMELAKSDTEAELTEEELKALDECIVYKENAEQVTGAVVDHLVVDLEKIPAITAEDIAEINNIIGAEGILFRFAAVGDNHVAVTFGGGQQRLATIIQNLNNEAAPLLQTPYVKKAIDRLPTDGLTGVGYLSVENLLAIIMNIANAVGQPLPVPLVMREAAPIAFTATIVDKSASQFDVIVPMELVLSAKDMVVPMMSMMMMGGGGEIDEGDLEEPVPPPVPDSGIN